MVGFAFLAALLAQQAQPDPALVQAQSLLDAGQLSGAESAVRAELKTHPDSADAHYLLGYVLFREQNPKTSLAEYAAAARYRPPAALDLQVVGCDYLLLEDYASAADWLAKSVERDPSDAHAFYYLGRAQYNRKHFEEAVRAFSQSLKLDPGNPQTGDNLGLAYEALGKTEDALAAYRAAVSLDAAANPRTAGPYLDLGALLVEENHPGDAIPPLLEAAAIAPQDPLTHRALGKAYLALNRLEEAQAEFEKAVDLAPRNAPLHFLLAEVYRKRGLADRARVESDRYAALTGDHSAPDTPLSEARALLGLEKFPDAERVLRQFLKTRPASADAHFLLGYVLFKEQNAKSSLAEYTEGAKYRTPTAADLEAVAGDYVLLKDFPAAEKGVSKAVEWNPQDTLGWYYLGRTKYNENRFDEAVAAFQRCLKLDPKNVKAEDNLGLSYEGLNRTEDAIAAYKTALAWQADSPLKDPGPPLDLGSLLVDSGRAAEALPYLTEAARLSPQDYRVHRQLGKAYANLERLESARAELEKASQLAPQNAPVHFMLAQVYRKQGLMDKAKMENDRYSKLTGANSTPDN